EECKAAVTAVLHQEGDEESALEEEIETIFDAAYFEWRHQCEDLDRVREEQERLERQKSADPVAEMLPSMAQPMNTILEGRRLKFSSEYDVQLVMKQSEETARLEREKHERESEKMQATIHKEARVADQQPEKTFERALFIDTNRLRDPETLTRVFSYEPQPDTFTENEQQIFIAAFKETPKKWGEISSLLPDRSYKDCIHHYYANKWDSRFRDKQKKFKGNGKRGRGGRAPRGRGGTAMADMAGTEELLPPPSMSESGRPRRAAAPTTFGEKEVESKATLVNPSPAKKPGTSAKQDGTGEAMPEKPGKRRKAAGDKPGRKTKAAQQPLLATLAAAPNTASPISRQFLPSMHTKEDLTRGASLEDATLLAGLQSTQNHFGMVPTEPPPSYHHEDFAPAMLPAEDVARMKALGQTSGLRSGASSYWSVPEQQDFVKYIAHFGTDFAAIADHMGTKTQTMIKNHYQRQVVNGNQPDLENAALEANRRREVGEDMGPPPTPTPIIKRKYDAPQPAVPRTLAPHTDAMEIDEPVAPTRQAQVKHMSPPQFQAQPRFSASAQSTPMPVPRVIPSPVKTAASPALPKTQAPAPARLVPHSFGSGLAFTMETRPESRPGLPPSNIFRHSQGSIPRSQPPPQSGQVDPRFMERLFEEQHRALRMQEEQSQQGGVEQLPRQPPFHRGSAQGSPADQPLREPLVERKPLFEERAATPPRAPFAQPPFARSLMGPSSVGPYRSTPYSLMGPAPVHPSPPKREESRPASVSVAPLTRPPPASTPAPPPEPPKRSNLLSILNDEPDEPKPPKRETLPSFPQRAPSPAQSTASAAPTPAPGSNMHPLRRETFGQPSMPQSQFHRSSFSQHGPPASATASSIKQEHAGGASTAQALKPDWAARVLGQGPQFNPPSQPSPTPTLEREVRSYFSHRATALGGLNQPGRANPSPPPHGALGHSRTPSLTMQAGRSQREQRPVGPGQAQQPGQGAPLHPNPYAQAPNNPPFAQPMPPEARNHAHHSHNSSLSGGFATFDHRAPNREDAIRQEQQQAQQAQAAQHRDRDQLDRMREVHEHEHRQREAQFYAQHRQQQQQQQQQRHEEDRERENRQRMFPRGPPQPPPPLQPPGFGGPAFTHERFGSSSIREQAQRETDIAIRQQQEAESRMREAEQRMAEQRMMEEARMRDQREHHLAQDQLRFRQQGETLFRRQTPLGGNYGHPPPPPPPQPRR
ncbi:hypothetical protein LTR53_003163, partial [Teratosphaeriaceae sp. CCFEE 6253]